MRKYYITVFFILAILFNNKVGECSLYYFDFKGHITEINEVIIFPPYIIPSETVAKILNVSIGSKMNSFHIYETDPYEFSPTHYGFNYPLIWDFKKFRIGGNPHLFLLENGDIQYIHPYDGFIGHDDGWGTYLNGFGFYLANKTGISYTLESLPTVLNLDNFDVTFHFGGEIPNPFNPNDHDITINVRGVIDKIKIHMIKD